MVTAGKFLYIFISPIFLNFGFRKFPYLRPKKKSVLPLHSSASASCHSLADQSSAPWLLDTWQTPRASACWAGVCVAGLAYSDFPNTVGWAGLQLQQLLQVSDSSGGICWLLLSTCLQPVTFNRYRSLIGNQNYMHTSMCLFIS